MTPNVTNIPQPADMGMIDSIKVGYKVTLLEKILSIFGIEGGYLRAYSERKKSKRGCKGIDLGGNPHLLDARKFLKPIWENDEGKYARVDWDKTLL